MRGRKHTATGGRRARRGTGRHILNRDERETKGCRRLTTEDTVSSCHIREGDQGHHEEQQEKDKRLSLIILYVYIYILYIYIYIIYI